MSGEKACEWCWSAPAVTTAVIVPGRGSKLDKRVPVCRACEGKINSLAQR